MINNNILKRSYFICITKFEDASLDHVLKDF